MGLESEWGGSEDRSIVFQVLEVGNESCLILILLRASRPGEEVYITPLFTIDKIEKKRIKVQGIEDGQETCQNPTRTKRNVSEGLERRLLRLIAFRETRWDVH